MNGLMNVMVFAIATNSWAASLLQSPLPMVVMMFAIMYFIIIRPQQRKQKEHADMLTKLQKNDEVITSGGIHGIVVAVNEKTLSIRVADNVKIEIEKSHVLQKK